MVPMKIAYNRPQNRDCDAESQPWWTVNFRKQHKAEFSQVIENLGTIFWANKTISEIT